jgi:signal recognition particle subunit SRP54
MATAMKRLKKMGGLSKLAALFNKGGLEGALGGLAPPGALPPGGLPGGGGAALPGLGGQPFNLPPGFDKFSKK